MRCAILLRAVNVAGRGRLPMADLREALEAGGLREVATYIQSGNVVADVDGDPVAAARAAMERRFGAAPRMVALTGEAFRDMLATCPYPEADPARVVALVHDGAAPDALRLSALAAEGEEWAKRARALWVHCPDGLGRSMLAAGAERALGVLATGRNLRTLRALASML